jgi:DNA-binding transcriptional regulator YdaS (Cro superfamily)
VTMKLKNYLDSEQITITAFAKRIGVSPEAVRLWCLGVRTPRWKAVQAIRSATEGKVEVGDFEPGRVQ